MIPGEPIEIQKQELNSYVLFVVDDTISMLADDGEGGATRLAEVSRDVDSIVDGLPGAHFSVLSFHNEAVPMTPYSDNGEHIKNIVASMYPPEPLYAHGSSMNVALDAMKSNIKEIRQKDGISVYVIFISDGEITNEDKITDFSEVGAMIDGGAVVGYGTEEGGIMQYKSWYDEETQYVTYWDENWDEVNAVSCIDEQNLMSIAKDMNVPYIHAAKPGDVDVIVESFLKDSKKVLTKQGINTIDSAADTYFVWLFPLVVLLVWEAVEIVRKK